MKSLRILLVLIATYGTAFSQSTTYEATEAQPYGKPNPEASEKLLDFSPMIGTCDCLSETRKQDQSWNEPVKMIWRFKYIMNGLAVQDEVFSEGNRYAGSIRQVIEDKWYVHYYSSQSPSKVLPAWEGELTDNKIVLYREQKAPNGMEGFFRITFYDMSDNGFKWIGEWVDTNEKIVYPTWKINCKKRKE